MANFREFLEKTQYLMNTLYVLQGLSTAGGNWVPDTPENSQGIQYDLYTMYYIFFFISVFFINLYFSLCHLYILFILFLQYIIANVYISMYRTLYNKANKSNYLPLVFVLYFDLFTFIH